MFALRTGGVENTVCTQLFHAHLSESLLLFVVFNCSCQLCGHVVQSDTYFKRTRVQLLVVLLSFCCWRCSVPVTDDDIVVFSQQWSRWNYYQKSLKPLDYMLRKEVGVGQARMISSGTTTHLRSTQLLIYEAHHPAPKKLSWQGFRKSWKT